MLLPISHDKMTVRRWPLVTIVLVVLTIAVHALMSAGDDARAQRVVTAFTSARGLYVAHTALGACKPLGGVVRDEVETGLGQAPEPLDDDGDDSSVAERYVAACRELDAAVRAMPSRRFGFVPADGAGYGLVTYMFVHADWWHVIGNMWFLFLCGLALEDRWGRLAFLGHYLVAGVVAAWAHRVAMPASTAGLVGASGAVAGAMGAFFVLFATTKIRFVGFLGVRIVMFHAPALVMLPLWLALEVALGALGLGGGTAHWAHVGGFCFGATVAGVFRIAGVDRKLDDAVDRAALLGADPRIDAARGLLAKGDAAQAVALLEGLAKDKPESVHVWQALRDAAEASGEGEIIARASRRIQSLHLVAGRDDEARAAADAAARASRPSLRVGAASRPPASAAEPAPFFPPVPPKK